MSVKVSFTYTPDDPDDDDPTGLSEEEHQKVFDTLMHLGAEDISIEKN